jgi:roadblock/LC7 domain-containing protein
MAFTQTRKVLGLLTPADTNEATLYTVPTGKSAEVTLYLANITASAATITVKVKKGATTVAIMAAKSYAANTANDTTPVKLFLGSGDSILVTSGTLSAISYVATGIEYDAQ